VRRGERIPLHDHSDFNSGGLVAATTIVQAAGSSLAGGSDHAHPFLADPGDGRETYQDHGIAGAAETIDPSEGNVHALTLDENCTATISEPVGSGASTLELWVTQDGSGGNTLTIAATGGAVTGDISAHTTSASETFRVIAERIPGTTNDWIVDLVGGGSSVAALDDLTDVTITTPTTADRLRYNGSAWVNSTLKWVPATTYDGTNWLPAVDGSGNAIMTEA
jgi:hypothetical protein